MSESKYLSPALLGDKSHLSPQARNEIHKLSGERPREFLFQAFSAWGIIITSILLAIHVNSHWMSLACIIIVATRMNILALLAHEQVHLLGSRNRHGDIISNIIAAYPLGITVEGYAKIHLAHHKHYFTNKDPDFLRKSGKEWAFPLPFAQLIKLILSDLIGLSFIKLIKSKRPQNESTYKRPYLTPPWLRPAFYILLAILLTHFALWQTFLLYWVLPLITVFPLIVRLGAISEHIYNSPGASIINSTPIILQKWWEKLLLPNLNFTLHAYHHFFPGIAFCNLPKVHEIFQREHLVDESSIFYGHWDYIRYLQKNNVNIMAAPSNKNSAENST